VKADNVVLSRVAVYAARYVHVDMTAMRRSPVLQLHTAASLEDVSADCMIGVDDRLTLYDLAQGQVYKTITYRADAASQHALLQVRDRHRQLSNR